VKPSDLWQQWGLSLNDKKAPHTNLHNAALILENDPTYKDCVYFDDFLQRVIRRNSPVREWQDADDLEITRHIQSTLGITRMTRDAVAQAVSVIATRHRSNCVKEWIESLTWDGTSRLESFFSDYFCSIDSPYTRSAAKNFWLSIIARVYKPGCKVDNMIVLEGSQGLGKSTALQTIGGDWFAEQHESALYPKAFAEILQGKLLIEISEMEAFTRVEVSRVKQTVSCASDRFRASYARYASDHPRTCVFVGTTNRDDWNRDETGARRFWPIACSGIINLEGIRNNRDSIFAEARARFLQGENHWEMPLDATTSEQEARFQADPWQEQIDEFIKGERWITTARILEKLGVDLARRTKSEEMRVAACLRYRRWQRKAVRVGKGGNKVYVHPDVLPHEVATLVTGGNTQNLDI
jgi:predicted P-loop ATPase